jgi:ribonuclease BN (tRNA processing enzyme)
MIRLTPIGIGAGLSMDDNNTPFRTNSWYFIYGHTMYIFDCGYSTGCYFTSKEGRDILVKNHIKEVVVLITHMHEDHCGGLSMLWFAITKALGRQLIIYVPDRLEKDLEDYLRITGTPEEAIPFITYHNRYRSDTGYIDDTKSEYRNTDFLFRSVPQRHVFGMNCYGYFIYPVIDNLESIRHVSNEWTLYYSGDISQTAATSIMLTNYLTTDDKSIERTIYQEVTFDEHSDVHYPYKVFLNQLTRYPVELRKNIFLMHIKNKVDEKIIVDAGFGNEIGWLK